MLVDAVRFPGPPYGESQSGNLTRCKRTTRVSRISKYSRFVDVGLRQNSGGGAALVHGCNIQTLIRQIRRFSFLVIQQADLGIVGTVKQWQPSVDDAVSSLCLAQAREGTRVSGKGVIIVIPTNPIMSSVINSISY